MSRMWIISVIVDNLLTMCGLDRWLKSADTCCPCTSSGRITMRRKRLWHCSIKCQSRKFRHRGERLDLRLLTILLGVKPRRNVIAQVVGAGKGLVKTVQTRGIQWQTSLVYVCYLWVALSQTTVLFVAAIKEVVSEKSRFWVNAGCTTGTVSV